MFAWHDDRSGVVRAVTDRSSGVSTGAYAGLNLGGHVGDDPETGWVAVLAVAPGTDGCIVDWDNDDGVFRDCEGTTYPPDGEGLDQNVVERFARLEPRAELGGLLFQLRVAHRLIARLEFVDRCDLGAELANEAGGPDNISIALYRHVKPVYDQEAPTISS